MSESSQTNDLRNRIIFTIFILAIYRLGTFVPLPGIDPEQLKIMMDSNQKGLLGMFNVFAGGAVSRMAIFALGIMPYISSSIIIQLLTGVTDYFKNLKIKFGKHRGRITEIKTFDNIIAAKVVAKNQKLYVNKEEGFIGTRMRKDEFVCNCSDIDEIIVFRKDGKVVVTKVDKKTFVGKNIIHVAVF